MDRDRGVRGGRDQDVRLGAALLVEPDCHLTLGVEPDGGGLAQGESQVLRCPVSVSAPAAPSPTRNLLTKLRPRTAPPSNAAKSASASTMGEVSWGTSMTMATSSGAYHVRSGSLRPFKYAQARIPHFWRVEDEIGAPTVHTYELDTMTSTSVATGIHRHPPQPAEGLRPHPPRHRPRQPRALTAPPGRQATASRAGKPKKP